MSEHNSCSTGKVFWSFILGGIVGAGVTLLLAPQSGQESRERIRELAEDIKDKTSDYVDQARDTVRTTVEKGKGFFENRKSVLSTAIEAGKE
ncbi:MAG TPA: YtxH domain-containing protein, partial [Nitrospirae bacterium]|nr:YtxH domain-containing protein [Nitrospirota bacterium]